MEAAASGLPVVATDIRGCRQVVDPGANGLLVPVADPRALARALRSLGDDDERREHMGATARAIACQRFDERAVVAHVMETYRSVASRKGLHLDGLIT
jgi:glycosyltransferase involved in cell wall biosynthesis